LEWIIGNGLEIFKTTKLQLICRAKLKDDTTNGTLKSSSIILLRPLNSAYEVFGHQDQNIILGYRMDSFLSDEIVEIFDGCWLLTRCLSTKSLVPPVCLPSAAKVRFSEKIRPPSGFGRHYAFWTD
ncbi:hypothetical protein NPIL_302871, partial [Nephila pilipes]